VWGLFTFCLATCHNHIKEAFRPTPSQMGEVNTFLMAGGRIYCCAAAAISNKKPLPPSGAEYGLLADPYLIHTYHMYYILCIYTSYT
jgi:hypothetical protein